MDEKQKKILLWVAVFALVAIIAGACVMIWAVDQEAKSGIKESLETADTEGFSTADSGEETGTEGENGAGEETGTGESEGGQTEGSQDSQADSTVSAEAQSQETTEAGTESAYLENLSGLAPGTVLEAAQIDFQNLDQYFMSWKIEEGDNLYGRINGKSYKKNDTVPLEALRYLKMPHYNFEGRIQVGEIVVNKDIEKDIKSIFKELFEAQYQIQSMYLVDNYWTGDPDTSDSASIDKNNTSAFCFRQVTGGSKLSNHAYGKAIDINPQQNPYVSYSSGKAKWSHSNANDYIARDTGLPHVITHEDLAYKVFTKYGFKWGGDWNNPKDYQHFEKN